MAATIKAILIKSILSNIVMKTYGNLLILELLIIFLNVFSFG